MKFIDFYKKDLNCKNEDEVFNFLISNLKPGIISWSYFVNWDKVFHNTKKVEIALNNLNYLIGKEDFDNEFRLLIKENPKIANFIPALLVRTGSGINKFNILLDYSNKKLVYEEYDFYKENIDSEDIEKFLIFIKETGLKNLLVSQKIKNLVDYMIGVEAGLDSNARKNRAGNFMEFIVEVFIKDVCRKRGYNYIKEANAEKIKKEWGYDVPFDKSSRRYDFVINTGNELIIFETNFYGGGGSKLKSTAGEYQNLFNLLNTKYKFIWITDGLGWKSVTRPLREAFNHIDHLISLAMLEKGILDKII